MRDLIMQLAEGRDLTEAQTERVMAQILDENATPSQIGSFLVALRMKGETVDEIVGAAKALRLRTRRLQLNNHLVNIDRDEINVEEETVLEAFSAGEERTNTFNVSTATAFVAAGAGVRVVKQGARAASSRCGSADVLRNLGIKLDINYSSLETCVVDIGIGFLYAPLFNGSLKHITEIRREIGLRTIFNLIGPLINPAGATAQVLGVYSPDLTEKMARVLHRLGTREAFVVNGEGTFDEISICGPTHVSHLKQGIITQLEITPEAFGLQRAPVEHIRGGNARENALIIQGILDGETGPKRDTVLLNAAAAFAAAGLDADMHQGIERAKAAIDSGKARKKLDAVAAFTQNCNAFVRKEL